MPRLLSRREPKPASSPDLAERLTALRAEIEESRASGDWSALAALRAEETELQRLTKSLHTADRRAEAEDADREAGLADLQAQEAHRLARELVARRDALEAEIRATRNRAGALEMRAGSLRAHAEEIRAEEAGR